jgi:hypothetical protein
MAICLGRGVVRPFTGSPFSCKGPFTTFQTIQPVGCQIVPGTSGDVAVAGVPSPPVKFELAPSPSRLRFAVPAAAASLTTQNTVPTLSSGRVNITVSPVPSKRIAGRPLTTSCASTGTFAPLGW